MRGLFDNQSIHALVLSGVSLLLAALAVLRVSNQVASDEVKA
jgi:hypothetical protein